MRFFLFAFSFLIVAAASAAEDAPDTDYSAELLRIAPLEPKEALASFEVHPDFEMQLVAAEPLVHDPIAMAFDEQGRMFVVEMRGYSERREAMLGAVRMLSDVDGDGVYDKSDVYVDGLAWPTAVACYDGGIFVAEPPNIFYCKDTDGDGRADRKEVWYTGFSLANVQGMVNSFNWGLDNRIHASASSNGGEILRTDKAEAPPLTLRGRDFSFDPRTRDIRAESGGGQHGMTFDVWGRKFVCHNSDHIMQIMYDDARTTRNPYMRLPGVRRSIAVEGPAADVYRISPVEPWREVRTRLRVQGLVPGPIEGGGKAAGYFTSATGITVYKGDAWPELYRGNVFIGDVGSNLIHRKIIEETGIQLTARRADPNTEFVRSRDIWFRPVQFANAPDGTLFVADMYREVIEHPDSLPPIIKQHLDLNSGEDRGRIYRIAPKGFKVPKLPDMGKATTAELVAYLEHPNAWHRETASRLIYEQQKKDEAVPELEKFLAGTPTPLGYINALYALKGLRALNANMIKDASRDKNTWVNIHTMRLAEELKSEGILIQVPQHYYDDDINVRFEEALSNPSFRYYNISHLHDLEDEWMRFAFTLSSLKHAPDMLRSLLKDTENEIGDGGRKFLLDLAYFSGITSSTQVESLLRMVDALNDNPLKSALIKRIFDGMKDGGKGSFNGGYRTIAPQSQVSVLVGENYKNGKFDILHYAPEARKMLDDMLATARNTAVNTGAPEALRVDALSTLALDTFESAKPILEEVLKHPQASNAIREKAIKTLGAYRDIEATETILAYWETYTPQQRALALEILFARTERIALLLDNIAQKKIDPRALDSNRRSTLLNYADPDLRNRAATLIETSNSSREKVLAHYAVALEMQGNLDNGKKVFVEQCAQCHRFGGEGHNVGPDLTTMAQAGAEKILVNVLDPNREVNPQYINYTIDTVDFESHSGIIAEENASGITLRRANGEGETVPRSKIEKINSSEMSIMPEGLEAGIDLQAMADLIAYITATK